MNRLVIGCGYLGSRVASTWTENGDSVWATTRSLARAGTFAERQWRPLIVDITRPDTLKIAFAGLPHIDTALVAVGFDRNSTMDRQQVYVDGLRHVLEHLPSATKHLIYISSTGVYGDARGAWVDESTPPNPIRAGGQAIWQAEQMLNASPWKKRSTVLRLAGLYGPGRVPNLERLRQKLSGQDIEIDRNGYLNLVHVADAARVVVSVAENDARGDLFLVSDGMPVLRRDYYAYLQSRLAGRAGRFPEPCVYQERVTQAIGSGKRISHKKLVETLRFHFQFPNYQVGLDDALTQEKSLG